MSKCQPELAMRRIDVATPHSPIAIFGHKELGYVDCVFGNTTETNRRIASGQHGFVGLFHGGSPRESTLTAIREAARLGAGLRRDAARDRRSA